MIGQGRRAWGAIRAAELATAFSGRGAFGQDGDAALSMARGGGKTTFTAAIACAAVDVAGRWFNRWGNACWLRRLSIKA